MNTDIFGNPVLDTPAKKTKRQTKSVKPTPTPLPVKEPQPITPITPVEVELGDINATYEVGDRVEYLHPKITGLGWEEGILLGFYDPRDPEETKQRKTFSFIEVKINGVIKKAYSLQQIRKAQ
jgi:hypothetical protein